MTTRRAVGGAVSAVVVVAVGSVALYAAGRDDDSPDPRLVVPSRTVEATELAPAGPSLEPADTRLLPNLVSLPPEDVLIELDDGERQLRFTSIIANTGVGPVETVPDDEVGCPPGQRHAAQRIYHDVDGDGQFDWDIDVETTNRPAGCMLDHPEHNHWHFDAAARYVLTGPAGADPIVSADKVSFCWRDNREVPAEADPPHDPHYGDCDYDEVQGIMPGWADVYGNELADQHLALPAELPDGRYCLWNEADPYNLLIETDETDNSGALGIEIDGTTVEPVPDLDCAALPSG